MWLKEFEASLDKQIAKRRWIIGSILLGLLAIGFVSLILREMTKEVIVHEGTWFIPGWEEVQYDPIYLHFLLIGFVGAIYPAAFLLADLIGCGYKTVFRAPHYITSYHGFLHNIVYVDGKEVGRIGPGNRHHVIEFKLPDGVKVIVSYSRFSRQITYSDDTPSVEF